VADETKRVPPGPTGSAGGELNREIATIDRDVTAPLGAFTLHPRDEVLMSRGGGAGLKIYDDLKRDPHAGAVLRKRRLAIVARDWTVEPASEAPADRAAAELVEAAIKRLSFDRLCLGLSDATLKGFAVAELIWAPKEIDGRTWVLPVEAKVRSARRFVFGRDGALRLLTWERMLDGEPLPDRKFLVHRVGEDESEDPYGLGLGPSLFWPVFFKKKGITFWLVFADKFGSPTAIGEYDKDITSGEQSKLLAALGALAQDTGVIIPKGTAIKLLEAQRSGAVDTYERLCRYMDEQISECVLGETLTTSVGSSGSRALGEVHNDVREELTDADCDLLSETLNRTLVRWIVEINMPGASPPEVWRRKKDGEDLNERSKRDKNLMDAGWEPEDGPEYMARVYGDRWVKKSAPAEKAPPPAGDPSFAEPGVDTGPVDTFPAALVDRLAAEAGPLFDAPVAGLRELAASAASIGDLAAQVVDLFGALDVDALAAILRDAFVATNLAGGVEIQALDAAASFAEAEPFSLPFKEQAEFFRAKVNLPTDKWTDILKGQHARAFVVAGAARDDLLVDLRAAVDKVVASGGTIADFRRDFDAVIAKTGWQYKGGRDWRTRVIYETNLRTSYQAGRYAQMTHPDVMARRPFWQYKHGDSARPRKAHLAWDGIVRPADDPWFRTHFAPNGWGCHCSVRPLSLRDMARLGKTGPDPVPNDGTYDWTDDQGNLIEAGIPNGIDRGWNYNVGEAAQGRPVGRDAMDAWKASGEARWKPLTEGDTWDGIKRPQRIPAVPVPALPSVEATGSGAMADLVEGAIGAPDKVFQVPGAGPVHVDAKWVGDHLDPARARFVALLPQLLADPFEVWMRWEVDQLTGAMALRKYILGGFAPGDGGDKYLLMVAQAHRGQFEAWTAIPSDRHGYIQKRRVGELLYSRDVAAGDVG
jgi:hypothetical protein